MGGDKDSDEEDDLYGGDAEEELEELQDVMIRKIQALYRKKRARALLKQLIKANYVKEYDEETGHFLYRNKRTGEKQFHKPMVLGSDDLEDPKVYVCPPEYSNEPSAIRYFGIVVTNAMFDASKIPPLDTSVVNDHNSLSELLSHPYKCKFREDDCIFLRDASLSAVVNSMESLQVRPHRVARKALQAAQHARPSSEKRATERLVVLFARPPREICYSRSKRGPLCSHMCLAPFNVRGLHMCM